MFWRRELPKLVATLAAAVSLATSVPLGLDPPLAHEIGKSRRACPQAQQQKAVDCLDPADRTAPLDESDEIATLGALQIALSEVGDGATYVWHRHNGRISGSFQPLSSYRDWSGKVCRHVRIMLASGSLTRTLEGVACRLPNGAWQLDG
jgi:surface antigen